MNETDIVKIIESSATIGDVLVSYLDYVIFDLIRSRYPELQDAIHLLITTALLLVCTIRSILAMTGKAEIQLKEALLTTVWAVLATTITTPSNYEYWVLSNVSSVTSNLGSYFVGDFSGQSTFVRVEAVVAKVFKLVWIVTENLDAWDIGEIIIMYLLAAVYGALYILFIIILVYAKFALGVLLLTGGLVILLSPFKIFRGMLKSWAQAITKYGFSITLASIIILLSVSLCSVALTIFLESTGGGDTSADVTDYLGVMFWLLIAAGLVSLFLMFKVFELTSEITGGVATDMSNSVNAAGTAANAAMAPIKAAATGLGKSAVKKFGG